MSCDLYRNLEWLPLPPKGFRDDCRAAIKLQEKVGRRILQLAGYALDGNQLRRLADTIDKLRREGRSLVPLIPFKLGLLGNGTLNPIVPLLVGSAARHGIALECIVAEFAQTVQEALSPDSTINNARPDAVLLALDYRGLALEGNVGNRGSESLALSSALRIVDTLRSGFQKHCNALSIIQTLAPPPDTIFGNLDRAAFNTPRSLTDRFNAAIIEGVRKTQDVILDVAALAETVGLANWHSPTQWNIAKLAFDSAMLPLYADHVGRILGALRGKSRRCLTMDLDNTIWGGVVGDEGLEGIIVGQGDATGEAYLDLQRAALQLRERGVILAVSSKNDDELARAVFLNHPDMLLRQNHIAVFQANWSDKATNILAIASQLSLGLDALVFLDDNPVERGLVRNMLPEVAVPELPDDPALYARTLAAAGYFETIYFSEEDRKRAAFYEDNARRVTLQETAGDIGAYLASLNMQITFRPFDPTGRNRITQLVNKSNQFNLTTRRYNELEIAAFESDSNTFTLQVRLADIFGDNGMISVVICETLSQFEWQISTWLMSCRVLGRRVEQMVLREIILHARARGIKRLIGIYEPSARNAMVKDHYPKLGFQLSDEKDAGTTLWTIPTNVEIEVAPMAVARTGFDLSPV